MGGSQSLKGASQFLEWKLDNKLLDVPYQGVNYTWTNNRSNDEAIYERIDKAFCNTQWRDSFPDAEVWNLPILLSDHSPIVLQLRAPSLGKKKRPYRLDVWCLNYQEVRDLIKSEWDEEQDDSPAFILQRKIQKSLRMIREWCLNFKNTNKIDWRDIHNSLSDHQQAIFSPTQAQEYQEMRKKVLNDIEIKSDYWRQRAKSRWDDLGDRSSTFFYRSVKGRSSRNEIKAIKNEEGTWTSDQTQIKKIFLESFKEIYQSDKVGRDRINHEDPFLDPVATLSQHHIELLSKPFSRKEIKEACFSSKPLKSPGPDGTPPAFFHQNWSLIGPDVINSVNSFLSSGYLLKEQNRTFITLIPKKDRPQETKDF
ncbi:hypothetical protein BVRB_4g087820 [Beta vulgaris subsp. vulgaris]|nr:hypothetical protein BVRB_4g087820 [Beta vulgaris subsp. vulgaris]